MKVVVIGGVAGGASAAARIRRLDEQAEIVMFERGEHVSFSNCSLPYYISGTVPTSEALVMMSPEKFKKQHNIDARVRSEVIAINRAEKTVTVKDLQTGATYDEPYDKLVLAPGANAVVPKSIRGVDQPHVFAVRNVTDIRRLKDYADQVQARNIVVAGGGFVGLEIAENFCHAGKHVTLVEGSSQVMAPFDFDMAQILHKELLDQGMDVYLSSMVTEITPNSVIAKRGEETVEIPADVVLLSIGVRQETTLAQKAGLEIGAIQRHQGQPQLSDQRSPISTPWATPWRPSTGWPAGTAASPRPAPPSARPGPRRTISAASITPITATSPPPACVSFPRMPPAPA